MDTTRPCRTLVVDDNAASAMTLKWLAESYGCDAMMCHDGPSALELCDVFRPDVIFLDLGMRGMNGIEVCEALRRDPRFSDVRIVAQTGWGDARTRQKTEAAGFDEHLVKPVCPQRFAAIIADIHDGVGQDTPARKKTTTGKPAAA